MSPYTLYPKPYSLLVIVGPTASGKSELAVQLAARFNGEIISADSRQIYKGMDIGTGKVEGKWKKNIFVYKSIPHHLIDFQNPKKQYSAALFQRDAKKIIEDAIRREKLPILCGGTAHWIDAVVYNQTIPEVKPNPKLRASLEKKSADDLYQQLKKIDPARSKTIDRYNKHRLIRALEIVITSGKPVPVLTKPYTLTPTPYNPLFLGINPPQTTLYQKIDRRLKQRIKSGMIKEVSQLHQQGLSWKRLMDFGLEYKFVALYLQKKLTRDEMFKQLSYAIKHYSKRQMTWWKRNKKIEWIKNPPQASRLVEKFLE